MQRRPRRCHGMSRLTYRSVCVEVVVFGLAPSPVPTNGCHTLILFRFIFDDCANQPNEHLIQRAVFDFGLFSTLLFTSRRSSWRPFVSSSFFLSLTFYPRGQIVTCKVNCLLCFL